MKTEQIPEEDEFQFNEMLSSIRKEFSTLLALIKKHYKVFIGIHILLLIGSIILFKTLKPKYAAERTFILENGTASGLGALTGFSNFLGLNKPGEGNEKYLELLSSPNFMNKILQRSYKHGDRKSIIEHYIKLYKKRKDWTKSSDSTLKVISNVNFSPNKLNTLEKLKQNVAVQIVAEEILDGKSYTNNYDKKTGVFSIGYVSTDAAFSLEFLNAAYDEFKELIYKDLFEQSNENLNITKAKLDSVFRELKRTSYQYANKTDRTLGLILQEDNVPKTESYMKLNGLVAVYGEALKQYETFKFVNQSEKINFLVISEPILPILPEKLKWKLYTALIQIGIFLIILGWVRARHYFKNIELN